MVERERLRRESTISVQVCSSDATHSNCSRSGRRALRDIIKLDFTQRDSPTVVPFFGRIAARTSADPEAKRGVRQEKEVRGTYHCTRPTRLLRQTTEPPPTLQEKRTGSRKRGKLEARTHSSRSLRSQLSPIKKTDPTSSAHVPCAVTTPSYSDSLQH